jgi:hypothetical protein
MKMQDFLLGALAGIVVYHILKKMKDKNSSGTTIEDKIELTKQVIEEEGSQFSDALKSKYNIVMPSDVVSKKVKKKAKCLTKGRSSVDPSKIQQPVSI